MAIDYTYPRIISTAKSYGLSKEDAEDVAQEVVCSWVRYERKHGEETSQTIDQAVIDACRKLFGSDRSLSSNTRKNARFGVSVQGKTHQEYLESLPISQSRDDGLFKEYGVDFRGFINNLGIEEKVIFKLIFEEEWSEEKVSNLFGVSPSRICQRYKGIQSRLSKIIARQKLKIQREAEGNLSQIPREKTCGRPVLGEKTYEDMEDQQPFEMASFDEASF